MSGPSLADIRRESDPARFPVRVLAGAGSAACFFCAAYLGRQDAIHVHDAAVRDVYLCDLDAEKVAAMRAIYPAAWRFELGDAYRLAERLLRRGAQFDVVIADAWAGHADRLLTKTFPLWYGLARRHLVLMAPMPWFRTQGAEPTPDGAAAALRRLHRLDVVVEELVFRSDWMGGSWWLVVRKDDPRHGLGVAWDHSDDDTLHWRIRRKLRRLLGRGGSPGPASLA